MWENWQTAVASVVAGAWSGVAILVVLLLTLDGLHYLRRRRAMVDTMQRFGEQFVAEFERPLKTPGSGNSVRLCRTCVSSRVGSGSRSCSRPQASDGIRKLV